MKTFIIQGSHLKSIDDFYNQIELLFIKNNDSKFGRNLDALSDILYGGFGIFDEKEKIQIIWKDFKLSQKYMKNLDIIEEIIDKYEHITFIKK